VIGVNLFRVDQDAIGEVRRNNSGRSASRVETCVMVKAASLPRVNGALASHGVNEEWSVEGLLITKLRFDRDSGIQDKYDSAS
jgi:hypothetical protein